MNTFTKLRAYAQSQYDLEPVGASWHRVLTMLDQIEKEVAEQTTPKRSQPAFRVGSEAFNAYVFQKVNSTKDIVNIARRYDIEEMDVMNAYYKGQNTTAAFPDGDL